VLRGKSTILPEEKPELRPKCGHRRRRHIASSLNKGASRGAATRSLLHQIVFRYFEVGVTADYRLSGEPLDSELVAGDSRHRS